MLSEAHCAAWPSICQRQREKNCSVLKMKNKSLTTPKKGILQLHVFLYFQTVVVLLLPNFVQSKCSPGHLLLRLLEQRKKALKKTSRCCITGTSSLAKHSAVRQRSCLFYKTTQFQSFGLAMRVMLMEASICWRDGSWWRGGSCSRADKKQHRGGQGKVREGKMETL